MDTITSSMIESGRAAFRARVAARQAARAEIEARDGDPRRAAAAAAYRARSVKAARRAAHQAARLQEGWL